MPVDELVYLERPIEERMQIVEELVRTESTEPADWVDGPLCLGLRNELRVKTDDPEWYQRVVWTKGMS